MHRLAIFPVVVLALVATSPISRAAGTDTRVRPRHMTPSVADPFVPGEVLVRFRPGVSSAKVDPLKGDLGLVREKRAERLAIESYRLAAGGDVLETVRRLRLRPDVEFAEPNYLAQLAAVPNDSFYADVDGYERDLQRWTFGGVEGDTGINAEAAWDVTTGRPDVTIAIVDSGVSLTHPDLAPNIWTNPGEIPGNAIDDDGNGFVDDVHGWDFFSNDADPNPDLGDGIDNNANGAADENVFHGTFGANLAAGRGNDGRGVCGSAWNCSLMPIKCFGDDGGANNLDIAEAIQYAADNGADVINLSLSLRTINSTMQTGVEYAIARDCVVVAAAGNANVSTPYYPASFPGVLSVGATGHAFTSPQLLQDLTAPAFNGRGAIPFFGYFSNYGPTAVDVVAPGVVFSGSVASKADADLDSSLAPGDLIVLIGSGTSFSSPIVAGLAALMLSRDKDLNGVRTLSNADVVDIIQSTAKDLPDDFSDLPNGGATWDNHGRVDFLAALNAISGGGGGRVVRLAWQAPSGDPLGAPRNLTAEDAATPVAKLAAPVAEQEPNNTFGTAQQISIPTTINGTIQNSDDGEFEIVYDSGPSDKVEDLYKLSLTAQTTFSVTLAPAGAADLDLAVLTDLDGDGTYTAEQQFLAANPASGPQDAEALTNITLPAGTYYVACSIYDAIPVVASDTYTLSLTTGAPAVKNFRVYRSTSPGVATSEANRIAQVSGAQLAFVDTSAPAGDVYYVVTAVYDAGESDPSNEASPTDDPDPNAPVIVNPAYKNGKLTMAAAGSKIVAGTQLVVNDTETFALKATADQSKWVVKKKTRSVPGNVRISQALLPGQQARLYLVTPSGLRSAVVMFSR